MTGARFGLKVVAGMNLEVMQSFSAMLILQGNFSRASFKTKSFCP